MHFCKSKLPRLDKWLQPHQEVTKGEAETIGVIQSLPQRHSQIKTYPYLEGHFSGGGGAWNIVFSKQVVFEGPLRVNQRETRSGGEKKNEKKK